MGLLSNLRYFFCHHTTYRHTLKISWHCFAPLTMWWCKVKLYLLLSTFSFLWSLERAGRVVWQVGESTQQPAPLHQVSNSGNESYWRAQNIQTNYKWRVPFLRALKLQVGIDKFGTKLWNHKIYKYFMNIWNIIFKIDF